MAVLSISFDPMYNGIELVIPVEVVVAIRSPGTVGGNYALTAVSKQIDDNALVGLSLPNPNPQGPNFLATFNLEITTTDCPDVDTWYMLTIYAWDTDSDLTTQSLTFKRISS